MFLPLGCFYNAPMHRFRLYACLAAMLLVLGVGGFAWLRWGVPEAPYGVRQIWRKWYGWSSEPRRADPLGELEADNTVWIVGRRKH